jgi:hypothetical protein
MLAPLTGTRRAYVNGAGFSATLRRLPPIRVWYAKPTIGGNLHTENCCLHCTNLQHETSGCTELTLSQTI